MAVTDAPPDLPGLVYERLLGSGGYSKVYLYRQQLPLRHVAVKVLQDAGLKEGLRAQLTAEANAMASLADHPNIVPVISASVSGDGRPYIVMAYYSRPNLAVRANSERLSVVEVLRIGIQIASAIETAHRAGILHRDIKPANLLINQYGAPGLTDFGIAGAMADEDDEDTGVSVPWAAPEVLYATGPTSVRSDVYSLAATLWHLLVGRSPFEVRGGDNSAFELMRRIRDSPAPSTARADVPDSLNRLLRQAMAKDPRGRLASAMDFARGLQAIEQQLHLPRTEIVVLNDRLDGMTATPPPVHPGGGRPGYPPGAPATVARPMSFSGQSPMAPPTSDPSAWSPGAPGTPTVGATRAPQHVPADAAATPPTGRRATYTSQPGPTVAPGAPRRPAHADDTPTRRPIAGVVVAVALVAGAVAVGFALFSGGSDAGKPQNTLSNSIGTQNAGNPGENIPPGTPTIIAKQATKGQIVFTWTYSNPVSTDTFQVKTVADGKVRAVTKAQYAVTPPAGKQVCIQVRVLRADGSNAAPTFSRQACR